MTDDPRITGAVLRALAAVAASPSTAMQPADVATATAAVTTALAPTLEHVANGEPWWRSRVTWGAIISVAAGVAGIAGYALDAEDQQQLVDSAVALSTIATSAAAVVGGLIAWWGRWRARRPLGR